ncbi:MAG: cellulase family glycosylhydrolase, partial [Phycisphaerae bacterium]
MTVSKRTSLLRITGVTAVALLACAGHTCAEHLGESNAPKGSIVGKHGQLRVEGNRIVDKNGKPVALHGMSLFWSQWMGQYYNAEAVKWLRDDWGCTVVRAAMAVESGGYLRNPKREKQKVIEVIQAA